jgi:hypothetical protein
MSLFLDIGQGAGLAGASGVRPFLPPLAAGALARGDIGLDFDGTAFSFLESPGFLAAVLALAVVAYALDRAGLGRRTAPDPTPERPPERNPADLGFGFAGLAIGALLFGGSLAGGGHESWPGVIAGIACALLGYLATAAFLGRARRRLEPGVARLIDAYADGASLALAAAAIAVPPVSFLVLALFAWLLARGRRAAARKYEGLRILR